MLPYGFYKIVHILGIALSLVALGGLAVHALNGGQKAENAARTLLIAKLGVWTAFALVVLLPYRRPQASRPLLIALPLLAATAALMAVYKPT